MPTLAADSTWTRNCGPASPLAARTAIAISSQVEGVPGVKVAERELDDHPGEIGRHFRDPAFDEMFDLVGGKLLRNVYAPAVTFTHHYSFGFRPVPRIAASPKAAKTPPTAATQPKPSNNNPMTAAPASPPQ